MQCPPDQLNATERRAIQDAAGGVLWETLKVDWQKRLTKDPGKHKEFTQLVAARIDRYRPA